MISSKKILLSREVSTISISEDEWQ